MNNGWGAGHGAWRCMRLGQWVCGKQQKRPTGTGECCNATVRMWHTGMWVHVGCVGCTVAWCVSRWAAAACGAHQGCG